jgi:hypothetical protein
VGAELVEYLLTNHLPEFDASRLRNSTTLLYNDLLRQGLEGIVFEADVKIPIAGAGQVSVPILATTNSGKRMIIALSAPLTNDHPAASALKDLMVPKDGPKLIVVNELLVRGNLPAATRDVLQLIMA